MRSIAAHPIIAVLLATAACSKDREPERREPTASPTPTAAAVTPRAYQCREVAHHFVVEYLTLRASDDLAVHIEKDCELNDWTQEERACWMQIKDMSTHQKCVTEFAEPRMQRPDYKNPDEDEDDGFPDEEDEE